MIVNNLWHMIL